MEIPKAYDHKQVEEQIYAKWEKNKSFDPGSSSSSKTFSLVFPPANVTGVLHLGHALTTSIEDTLARWKRMQGYKTLYIPGTDHAAIATQAKVEAELYKKEKKTRHDFGREEFLDMVKKFAAESQKTILHQLKKLGASVDWSRLAYTMDDQRSLAVRTAFKNLYDMGLIYRGSRLVNWDPRLQTNVSDDEIEWKEEKTTLYYLKYGPFTIATARPETKFGDKYVVVHPEDVRYKEFADGQKIELEWINGPVTATVIKDKVIDMEFGTGAMTITPSHDAADYDLAQRHHLQFEPVIDLHGKLLPISGEFAGMHINKARPMIVDKLMSKDLLEKVEQNYTHRVATNSRGGGMIEPQIREQWFVAVEKEFTMPESHIKGIKTGQKMTLKKLMRHVVKSKQIQIVPEYFDKTYFHWIDNLRDWCISRQIIFGHQIPVWYKDKETYVGIEAPAGDGWKQDEDTLDTWFSSGLWSFSTLGWPDKMDDVKTFHPLSVMETGYDIIFFWVARMILMSGSLLGQIPFETVYLHGLVRDETKQKMSKSKGNVVNPLDIIDTYGTDALRFALIYANSAGTDQSFMQDRVKGMKHFANKIWNVSRYTMMNLQNFIPSADQPRAITGADKDILDKLTATTDEITKHLEALRFNEAAQSIYHFIWRELADKYVEASKPQLQDDNTKKNTQAILWLCLTQSLKLVHPFMPFISEHIWELIGNKSVLATESWPTANS